MHQHNVAFSCEKKTAKVYLPIGQELKTKNVCIKVRTLYIVQLTAMKVYYMYMYAPPPFSFILGETLYIQCTCMQGS